MLAVTAYILCSLTAQTWDGAIAISTHSARATQQQPTQWPTPHHIMQPHNPILERRHHCLASHSQSHAGGAVPHQCVPLCVAACAGSLPEADCSAIVAGHQAAARDTDRRTEDLLVVLAASNQKHSAPLFLLDTWL